MASDLQPLPQSRPPARLARWLRIDPATKPTIYAQVYASAEIGSANYWSEIVLSAGIATLGLVLNSPAVIIGAMLISPLMGPILATGLALAAGDLYLAVKAIANVLVSVVVAVLLSAFIVWLLPFHSATGEILARTNPNLLDLGVALFSGLAGSIAVGRAGGAESVTTLPGVAIAVAIMPPLCAIGFGLGSGANTTIMGGAGLLFLTNLVAIVTAAFFVFLLIGMNSPEMRAAMEHSRSGEQFAQRLSRSRVGRVLSTGGQLHWRIVMLIVLLGSIAIPLRTALLQLAGEAVTRAAVQEVVQKLVPPHALVSQQVEVGRHNVAVELVSTREIPAAQLRAAEQTIEHRSGRAASVSVSTVASQSELAELMHRIASTPPPAPAAPVPVSLQQLQAQITARVQPVLQAAWPQVVPFSSFSVAFAPTNTVIHVQYVAKKDLDPITLGLVQQQLQAQLQDSTLQLQATRTPAPTANTPAQPRSR